MAEQWWGILEKCHEEGRHAEENRLPYFCAEFPVLPCPEGMGSGKSAPPTPVSSQTRFLRESVVELVLLCMPPAMAMVRGSGKACLLSFLFLRSSLNSLFFHGLRRTLLCG